MPHCEVLFNRVLLVDGSGAPPRPGCLAVAEGRIQAMGEDLSDWTADQTVCGDALVLAPGFIDAHTHDDLQVIAQPQQRPKLAQGVTTVVVGNCGISASPVSLFGDLPDPMNLLGPPEAFVYSDFMAWRQAVDAACPATHVAALVGHTALRNNVMDRLDRPATPEEMTKMQSQLRQALAQGALGLSTGLAYASAASAPSEEVQALVQVVKEAGGLYATHLRTEFDGIVGALDEALDTAHTGGVPLIVSHLKCAGAANWGRSAEVLQHLERASARQPLGCDCYPYAASSSTLDVRQVTADFDIRITWSTPHPEQAGRTLAEIAQHWDCGLLEAAQRLQPAGAVYHGMCEDDVQRILAHPLSMVGSDGLPCDPRPHPRLWGSFPRVLAHYARDQKLFDWPTAIHKMTGLPAARFGLRERGLLREGYWADLVLFNPDHLQDVATFAQPAQTPPGLLGVWVNGVHSLASGQATGRRAGRFLPREHDLRPGFPRLNF
jgi:N-acyl-D-amino-acid deacylase